MSFFLEFLGSKIGQLAIVALLGFVVGFGCCWKWRHRTSRFASAQFAVADVPNGATLTVRGGLLGRKTRLVRIEGIAAPGLDDPMGVESRDSLKRLAGATVRIETEDGSILKRRNLMGRVLGASGADLALEQLRAGLATCEASAADDLRAAQRQAQRAKTGLWAQKSTGSRWWHFSCLPEEHETIEFPEPIAENQAMFEQVGWYLEVAAGAILAAWLLWAVFGAKIKEKWAGARAVTTVAAAIDTSQQVASYAALTAIRHVGVVEADPKAVEACEYLRSVVTAWPVTSNSN